MDTIDEVWVFLLNPIIAIVLISVLALLGVKLARIQGENRKLIFL